MLNCSTTLLQCLDEIVNENDMFLKAILQHDFFNGLVKPACRNLLVALNWELETPLCLPMWTPLANCGNGNTLDHNLGFCENRCGARSCVNVRNSPRVPSSGLAARAALLEWQLSKIIVNKIISDHAPQVNHHFELSNTLSFLSIDITWHKWFVHFVVSQDRGWVWCYHHGLRNGYRQVVLS